MSRSHEPYSPTRRDLLRAGLGAGAVSLGLPMLAGCRDEENRVPASFKYDISAAAKIDPSLLTWRQTAVHDLALNGAVDFQPAGHGRLAVARGTTVQRIDTSTWAPAEPWTLSEAPTAMTAATSGLFIAFHDRVEHWADGQSVRTVVDLGEPAYITSIAIDGDEMYLADAGNRQVLRFRGGDEVWRVGGYAIPSPYFDVGVHDGALWSADTGRHQLALHDAHGERTRSFGKTGMGIDAFCGCCNPCHFIVLADGRFVTAEKGLHRVKVLNADGSLNGVVAGAEQLGIDTSSPICMTTDCSGPAGPIPAALADGRLAVAHPVTGKVHVFEEVG